GRRHSARLQRWGTQSRRSQRRRLGAKREDVLTSVAETAGRVTARVVGVIENLTGARRKRTR
ncbi:MAG: hypothetical protein DMF65_04480, partial [Acidobacteria bacterium]